MRKVSQGLSVSMILVFSLVVLVKSQTASNQTKHPTTTSRSSGAVNLITSPEDVGLSSERLERIASAFKEVSTTDVSPGP